MNRSEAVRRAYEVAFDARDYVTPFNVTKGLGRVHNIQLFNTGPGT